MSARNTPAPCYCCEPCREEAVRAAAPDLLAALRGMLAPDAEDCQAEQGLDDGVPEPCGGCCGCLARAAIARAEGGAL